MATATKTFNVSVKTHSEFGELVMDALERINNYSVSFDGKVVTCNEISAPKVGMGMNSWQRGRAYSTITFNPSKSQISIETQINGWTGAIFNSKYTDEVCQNIASKIQNQDIKNQRVSSSSEMQKSQSTISVADEIVKLKKLLDDGIITIEEFNAKKKELLGL